MSKLFIGHKFLVDLEGLASRMAKRNLMVWHQRNGTGGEAHGIPTATNFSLLLLGCYLSERKLKQDIQFEMLEGDH